MVGLASVWMIAVVVVVCSCRSGLAAFEADLIDALPEQPAGVAPFKQYGGYVTVDASAGRALYYYFVEAETSPSSSPLTVWLNGGPGCSSLGFGAFTELGPFFPTPKGDLKKNDHAWNKYSNVLFVESPAGVGFSYSNASADYIPSHVNDVNTAKDNLMFLLGWLKKFPEYKGRPLYITGESYAG
ncbi:hypothetical protein L7F22_066905 [Adiantum nelumboides]|nr:hypothetical protein [Adiantum nelumboides]